MRRLRKALPSQLAACQIKAIPLKYFKQKTNHTTKSATQKCGGVAGNHAPTVRHATQRSATHKTKLHLEAARASAVRCRRAPARQSFAAFLATKRTHIRHKSKKTLLCHATQKCRAYDSTTQIQFKAKKKMQDWEGCFGSCFVYWLVLILLEERRFDSVGHC